MIQETTMKPAGENKNSRPISHAIVRWMAIAAAVFTLPLLYVGGTVTTYRVGMAVPDWPTTFGFNMLLYNFWNAPFGVQVEHSHRLYGFAVGVFTIGVCGTLWALERDMRIKLLGTAALALVIIQGYLGGTRVTQVSTVLAAVHGFMGQAFFGLLTILCVVTGRAWRESEPGEDVAGVRVLGMLIPVAIAAQLALGAWLRHFAGHGPLGAHATGAIVILGLAHAFWAKVKRGGEAARQLRAPARAAAALATLQLVLGIASAVALWPLDGLPRPVTFYAAVGRTLHQTTGAVLFATSIVIGLWSFGRLRASHHAKGAAWIPTGPDAASTLLPESRA